MIDHTHEAHDEMLDREAADLDAEQSHAAMQGWRWCAVCGEHTLGDRRGLCLFRGGPTSLPAVAGVTRPARACTAPEPRHDAGAQVDPPYGDTPLEWDRTPNPDWLDLAAVLTNSVWCFGSLRFWLSESAHFEDAGWRYAQEIIWQKHAGSGPNSDRFTRVHELAVHWYRGPWGDLHRDVPRTEWFGPDRKVRRHGHSPHRSDYAEQQQPWVDDGTRMAQSIIKVRSEHRRAVHPTQKPLGILRPLIQYSVPKDGLVLDPFAGSGSTLVAARDEGRRAIGIEAREDYCEAAVKRFSQGVLAA